MAFIEFQFSSANGQDTVWGWKVTPLGEPKAAVQLIHHSLLAAYRDGSDLKARQNMQRAAFFAGPAVSKTTAGIDHAWQIALDRAAAAVVGAAGAVIKATVYNGKFCRAVCFSIIILIDCQRAALSFAVATIERAAADVDCIIINGLCVADNRRYGATAAESIAGFKRTG